MIKAYNQEIKSVSNYKASKWTNLKRNKYTNHQHLYIGVDALV